MKSVSVILFCLIAVTAFAQPTSQVHQQLDQLIAAAQGKRIGMITNPSGCDELGNSDVDYLAAAHGTTITAFFAPEHGIRGDIMGGSGDYIDPVTGIPVYAVYGVRNAPTDAQLATVDLLVFDMQDAGVRFYTFVWTMTYCMEAAARNGKPFYVIDRPNPIGGMRVEGAPNTVDYGLVGRLGAGATFGVATRHGMTVGEIATMWNTEWMNPKVTLHVILMPQWDRRHLWRDTGRVFVKPSPNMRTPDTANVYPGTCVFEGSNLSEGRGTANPFEVITAPYVNAQNYADQLNALGLAGVHFDPITTTPTSSDYSGQSCGGVKVAVTDIDQFDPVNTGLWMLQKVWQMYPSNVTITSYADTLMAVPNLRTRIKSETVAAITSGWQPLLTQFRNLRQSYLLYPEPASVANWDKYSGAGARVRPPDSR